jgi:uncharacterized peroxidase-related enzyme
MVAHIEVNPALPGISALLEFRPETAKPLMEFAEVLLRGPNSLTRGERELIAAAVSRGNECVFCSNSHSAIAAELLPGGEAFVEEVCQNPENADITPKLKALLAIALATRESGTAVTAAHVEAAKAAGASEIEIHDTVLIAAAFCLFNRYVDGLGAFTPEGREGYVLAAKRIVAEGYTRDRSAVNP